MVMPGSVIRRPNWDNCVLEVIDRGFYSAWGVLKDIRENMVIDPEFVIPLDGVWLSVDSVEDILNRR